MQALYVALTRDPAAVVLFGGDASRGGFASGTIDLRATNAAMQGALLGQPGVLLRLILRHVLAPVHLLAARVFDRLIPHQDTAYVLTIGATVDSPVRGSALLKALEAALESRGARQVWVDTERSNTAALQFYRRAGYEVVAEAYGQVLLRRQFTGRRRDQ